jgi:hypothetical protein
MKEPIAWLLLVIAFLGLAYAISLVFAYLKLPDDINDDNYGCDCDRCNE